MFTLPILNADNVKELLPDLTDIEFVGQGGQKVVFKALLDGQQYAIKFASMPSEPDAYDADVAQRAKREVETMRDCSSPHLVRLGPLELRFATLGTQSLLYFSEEYIEGQDLSQVLSAHGPLPSPDVVRLGLEMVAAIQDLWALNKVHRDIKPGNIMRRASDGSFVLLDAGLAFDVVGESLSIGPVGTPIYFSPEQFDFSNRRSVLDFRSDMFSLGVTMYRLATGKHPFWSAGESSQSLYSKIRGHNPDPPSTLAPRIPKSLDTVILRMLGKSPHLRYRKCEHLIAALNEIRGH